MRKPRPSTSAIFHYATDLHRAMMHDYQIIQEAEVAAADEACAGVLLNTRGRELGLSDWGVFFGPPFVVQAYGSQELLGHLAAHPRTTRTSYEASWLESHLGATS